MRKKHLYIFNPEHDLALANGEPNYIPPTSARQMAEDLALLPIWYADSGSLILASSAYNVEFLKTMEKKFKMDVRLITPPELVSGEKFAIVPWGWNPALRKFLLSLGVNEECLPDLETLGQLRYCSHRARAVELLPKLQLDEYFCGESFYLRTPEEWHAFVVQRDKSLLKAPLSGSGKGLNWCKGMFTSLISGWCRHLGASQGGVIGEPVYDKVEDFAMEFYIDREGRASFVGYSMFRTGGNGKYAGNHLVSDEGVLAKLSLYAPKQAFVKLKECLEKELSALLGTSYNGYLGVDMMICRFPGQATAFRIHPCVEINMRMNMGVLAHCITQRYLADGVEGEFQISYHPADGLALEEHCKMEMAHPLLVKNGRIHSGYLSLVPVTQHSRYGASIICNVADVATDS